MTYQYVVTAKILRAAPSGETVEGDELVRTYFETIGIPVSPSDTIDQIYKRIKRKTSGYKNAYDSILSVNLMADYIGEENNK